MIVVADSTPLIALSRIAKLTILRDLYTEVLIPSAVMREVVAEGANRPGASEVSTASWITVKEVTVRAHQFSRPLDLGEREAILLALERPESILLIDELAGRREAAKAGIKAIGTVGALIQAKKKDLFRCSDLTWTNW